MENNKKFDIEYFKTLNDEQKEIYLYNILVYGIPSEIEIEEVN